MSILCNACGRLSQDPEFCDYCNADLGTSGKNLPPERCPLAIADAPLTLEQRHVLLFPENSILVHGAEHAFRVHWVSDYDWRERGPAIKDRQALRILSLPTGQFMDDVGGRWLAYRANPQAIPIWPTAALGDSFKHLHRFSADVHSLAHALEALHEQARVWLNFDPGALEEAGPLELPYTASSTDWRWWQITNLDVDAFPFGSMPERVRVQPQFAAPEVVQFRSDEIGPATDVFHLAMFAYYWLAGQLPSGLPGNGLESYDFAVPFLRVYSPNCPEGIIPVVMRGLAFQPLDRFETPLSFARALDAAIAAAQRRRGFDRALCWELGGCTRTGKAKTELQKSNEDAILVKSDEGCAIALVADGVSTCDIGSGGLASMMTTIIIENALADGCTHDEFPSIIAAATQRGSLGLLEWAIAHNCRADLEVGKDLMGTTLTVGWIQGHELSVANLGDSRAYLIADGLCEQLTVDGDLASDLLARGAAPEEVRELGSMARALRECVGGCVKTEDGAIGVLAESCTPRVSRWPLLPGDVLVFCTDGLVEEGYFLEPDMVAQMIRQNKERSATELATLLVEAADELQRAPTIMEPDGFGDNISCVVVKIGDESKG
jgi:serine/threonine protein phosphatase PrpC